MIYLSAAQVLYIHHRLIAETGGSMGIRDLGLLSSAISRPQATFAGEDLYRDLFLKAAALLESLVRNHPFVDGNKRVGITATALFLAQNGTKLTCTNEQLEHFTLQVAQGELTLSEMTFWLRQHSLSQT